MVLAGYTGLVSLGHAAFLGVGAYAHVYFTQSLGVALDRQRGAGGGADRGDRGAGRLAGAAL
jgi:ABC-type branched-subunit amino acid transport system permease subunit